MTTQAPPRWLSVRDAASYLGVSIATVRRWSDKGLLPVFITPGGQRRFDVEVLCRWVEERSR